MPRKGAAPAASPRASGAAPEGSQARSRAEEWVDEVCAYATRYSTKRHSLDSELLMAVVREQVRSGAAYVAARTRIPEQATLMGVRAASKGLDGIWRLSRARVEAALWSLKAPQRARAGAFDDTAELVAWLAFADDAPLDVEPAAALLLLESSPFDMAAGLDEKTRRHSASALLLLQTALLMRAHVTPEATSLSLLVLSCARDLTRGLRSRRSPLQRFPALLADEHPGPGEAQACLLALVLHAGHFVELPLPHDSQLHLMSALLWRLEEALARPRELARPAQALAVALHVGRMVGLGYSSSVLAEMEAEHRARCRETYVQGTYSWTPGGGDPCNVKARLKDDCKHLVRVLLTDQLAADRRRASGAPPGPEALTSRQRRSLERTQALLALYDWQGNYERSCEGGSMVACLVLAERVHRGYATAELLRAEEESKVASGRASSCPPSAASAPFSSSYLWSWCAEVSGLYKAIDPRVWGISLEQIRAASSVDLLSIALYSRWCGHPCVVVPPDDDPLRVVQIARDILDYVTERLPVVATLILLGACSALPEPRAATRGGLESAPAEEMVAATQPAPVQVLFESALALLNDLRGVHDNLTLATHVAPPSLFFPCEENSRKWRSGERPVLLESADREQFDCDCCPPWTLPTAQPDAVWVVLYSLGQPGAEEQGIKLALLPVVSHQCLSRPLPERAAWSLGAPASRAQERGQVWGRRATPAVAPDCPPEKATSSRVVVLDGKHEEVVPMPAPLQSLCSGSCLTPIIELTTAAVAIFWSETERLQTGECCSFIHYCTYRNDLKLTYSPVVPPMFGPGGPIARCAVPRRSCHDLGPPGDALHERICHLLVSGQCLPRQAATAVSCVLVDVVAAARLALDRGRHDRGSAEEEEEPCLEERGESRPYNGLLTSGMGQYWRESSLGDRWRAGDGQAKRLERRGACRTSLAAEAIADEALPSPGPWLKQLLSLLPQLVRRAEEESRGGNSTALPQNCLHLQLGVLEEVAASQVMLQLPSADIAEFCAVLISLSRQNAFRPGPRHCLSRLLQTLHAARRWKGLAAVLLAMLEPSPSEEANSELLQPRSTPEAPTNGWLFSEGVEGLLKASKPSVEELERVKKRLCQSWAPLRDLAGVCAALVCDTAASTRVQSSAYALLLRCVSRLPWSPELSALVVRSRSELSVQATKRAFSSLAASVDGPAVFDPSAREWHLLSAAPPQACYRAFDSALQLTNERPSPTFLRMLLSAIKVRSPAALQELRNALGDARSLVLDCVKSEIVPALPARHTFLRDLVSIAVAQFLGSATAESLAREVRCTSEPVLERLAASWERGREELDASTTACARAWAARGLGAWGGLAADYQGCLLRSALDDSFSPDASPRGPAASALAALRIEFSDEQAVFRLDLLLLLYVCLRRMGPAALEHSGALDPPSSAPPLHRLNLFFMGLGEPAPPSDADAACARRLAALARARFGLALAACATRHRVLAVQCATEAVCADARRCALLLGGGAGQRERGACPLPPADARRALDCAELAAEALGELRDWGGLRALAEACRGLGPWDRVLAAASGQTPEAVSLAEGCLSGWMGRACVSKGCLDWPLIYARELEARGCFQQALGLALALSRSGNATVARAAVGFLARLWRRQDVPLTPPGAINGILADEIAALTSRALPADWTWGEEFVQAAPRTSARLAAPGDVLLPPPAWTRPREREAINLTCSWWDVCSSALRMPVPWMLSHSTYSPRLDSFLNSLPGPAPREVPGGLRWMPSPGLSARDFALVARASVDMREDDSRTHGSLPAAADANAFQRVLQTMRIVEVTPQLPTGARPEPESMTRTEAARLLSRHRAGEDSELARMREDGAGLWHAACQVHDGWLDRYGPWAGAADLRLADTGLHDQPPPAPSRRSPSAPVHAPRPQVADLVILSEGLRMLAHSTLHLSGASMPPALARAGVLRMLSMLRVLCDQAEARPAPASQPSSKKSKKNAPSSLGNLDLASSMRSRLPTLPPSVFADGAAAVLAALRESRPPARSLEYLALLGDCMTLALRAGGREVLDATLDLALELEEGASRGCPATHAAALGRAAAREAEDWRAGRVAALRRALALAVSQADREGAEAWQKEEKGARAVWEALAAGLEEAAALAEPCLRLLGQDPNSHLLCEAHAWEERESVAPEASRDCEDCRARAARAREALARAAGVAEHWSRLAQAEESRDGDSGRLEPFVRGLRCLSVLLRAPEKSPRAVGLIDVLQRSVRRMADQPAQGDLQALHRELESLGHGVAAARSTLPPKRPRASGAKPGFRASCPALEDTTALEAHQASPREESSAAAQVARRFFQGVWQALAAHGCALGPGGRDCPATEADRRSGFVSLASAAEHMRELAGLPVADQRDALLSGRGGGGASKFEALKALYPEALLGEALLVRQDSPARWYEAQSGFVRSLAATSLASWALELGGRSATAVEICTSSGQVHHRQFRHLFGAERALGAAHTPRLPFRLTRLLRGALPGGAAKGAFLVHAEEVLSALRRDRHLILLSLDSELRRGGLSYADLSAGLRVEADEGEALRRLRGVLGSVPDPSLTARRARSAADSARQGRESDGAEESSGAAENFVRAAGGVGAWKSLQAEVGRALAKVAAMAEREERDREERDREEREREEREREDEYARRAGDEGVEPAAMDSGCVDSSASDSDEEGSVSKLAAMTLASDGVSSLSSFASGDASSSSSLALDGVSSPSNPVPSQSFHSQPPPPPPLPPSHLLSVLPPPVFQERLAALRSLLTIPPPSLAAAVQLAEGWSRRVWALAALLCAPAPPSELAAPPAIWDARLAPWHAAFGPALEDRLAAVEAQSLDPRFGGHVPLLGLPASAALELVRAARHASRELGALLARWTGAVEDLMRSLGLYCLAVRTAAAVAGEGAYARASCHVRLLEAVEAARRGAGEPGALDLDPPRSGPALVAALGARRALASSAALQGWLGAQQSVLGRVRVDAGAAAASAAERCVELVAGAARDALLRALSSLCLRLASDGLGEAESGSSALREAQTAITGLAGAGLHLRAFVPSDALFFGAGGEPRLDWLVPAVRALDAAAAAAADGMLALPRLAGAAGCAEAWEAAFGELCSALAASFAPALELARSVGGGQGRREEGTDLEAAQEEVLAALGDSPLREGLSEVLEIPASSSASMHSIAVDRAARLVQRGVDELAESMLWPCMRDRLVAVGKEFLQEAGAEQAGGASQDSLLDAVEGVLEGPSEEGVAQPPGLVPFQAFGPGMEGQDAFFGSLESGSELGGDDEDELAGGLEDEKADLPTTTSPSGYDLGGGDFNHVAGASFGDGVRPGSGEDREDERGEGVWENPAPAWIDGEAALRHLCDADGPEARSPPREASPGGRAVPPFAHVLSRSLGPARRTSRAASADPLLRSLTLAVRARGATSALDAALSVLGQALGRAQARHEGLRLELEPLEWLWDATLRRMDEEEGQAAPPPAQHQLRQMGLLRAGRGPSARGVLLDALARQAGALRDLRRQVQDSTAPWEGALSALGQALDSNLRAAGQARAVWLEVAAGHAGALVRVAEGALQLEASRVEGEAGFAWLAGETPRADVAPQPPRPVHPQSAAPRLGMEGDSWQAYVAALQPLARAICRLRRGTAHSAGPHSSPAILAPPVRERPATPPLSSAAGTRKILARPRSNEAAQRRFAAAPERVASPGIKILRRPMPPESAPFTASVEGHGTSTLTDELSSGTEDRGSAFLPPSQALSPVKEDGAPAAPSPMEAASQPIGRLPSSPPPAGSPSPPLPAPLPRLTTEELRSLEERLLGFMRRALVQVSDAEERSPSLDNLSEIIKRVLDTLLLGDDADVIPPASLETPYCKALANVMFPAGALTQAWLRTANRSPTCRSSKQRLVEALERGMADLEAGRQQDQTGSELRLGRLCAAAKRMGSIISSLVEALDDADFLHEFPGGGLQELDQVVGGRSFAWRHCDEVAANCEALADACEALILAHDRRGASIGSDMRRDHAALSISLVGGLSLHHSSREAILREVSARLQSPEGGEEADEALDSEGEQLRARTLREDFIAQLIDEATSTEKLERTYDSWMPWL